MTLVLVNSARVRYASGAALYFAQGVPNGLMNIALPAWLASQGVGAGEIASYLSVIVLPWAFKLLSGPLMDRFSFLAMGRRRPWVLGAQLGLALSLFTLGLIDRPAEQIGLLMALGVLINVFSATQDVAVDGMAIEVTPTDEQGRLNAFMAFGKAVGWGVTSAASGVLLVTVGLGPTAALAAIASAVVLVGFVFVREREGERRLPWSAGSAVVETREVTTLRSQLRGLNAVLWTRVSLVLMVVAFFDGLTGGYGQALMPIAAVKLFGFTTPEWSQLVAAMGLVGAAVALGLGPLIDRFGAKRMLLLTTVLVAVHALLLAETQYLWENTTYVRVMLAAWVLLGPVTMVCMIALAMALCGSAHSATQFAIYMSIANLGASAGARLYGMAAEGITYEYAYLLLGALTVVMIAVILIYRHRQDDSSRERTGARPHAFGFGGGSAGTFWSGAMRCPKCRCDMDPVQYDGVEVDRCSSCHGLWFDAGEVERLRTRRAAKAIDVGDSGIGRTHNAIDRYPCPRCGGSMVRMVDATQSHIWYEKCGACHGSYFDAGEFADLATKSIGDVFRRIRAPERA